MSAERVALEGAPFPGRWRSEGACREVPPSLFFPSRGEDVDMARSVCACCPVIEQCRDYALGVPGLKGVWGGLSESERKVLRQEAEASQAATPPPSPVAAVSPVGTLLAHLEQLTTYQGRWARVAHYSSVHSAGALASLLRRGRREVPPGRWRFEGHVAEEGEASCGPATRASTRKTAVGESLAG